MAILCAADANRLKNFICGANAFGNERKNQACWPLGAFHVCPMIDCVEAPDASTKAAANTASAVVSQVRLIDRFKNKSYPSLDRGNLAHVARRTIRTTRTDTQTTAPLVGARPCDYSTRRKVNNE